MSEMSPPNEESRRLSITKLQRQTAAGAELIALCQTITEDGSLNDFEILALESWLVESHDIDLPARHHLLALLRLYASDGVISTDERAALYKAVELTMPPDVRRSCGAQD